MEDEILFIKQTIFPENPKNVYVNKYFKEGCHIFKTRLKGNWNT
jgi:hypothetical protein